MKKYISFILLLIVLTSCQSMKEYNGVKVDKLIYQTIDYMGGYTDNYVLDFINNEYLKNGYLPDDEISELEVFNKFNDEEEKIFIDACYTYGLFNLAPKYTTNEVIMDGGGWSLVIYYEDGSIKESFGSNAWPVRCFKNLATYFYDICGEEVVANVPEFYATPPNVSYSFKYDTGVGTGSTNNFVKVLKANYKWNKKEVKDSNIVKINEEIENTFIFGFSYGMTLYTSNYHLDKRFNKIKVCSYDESLNDEVVVYEGGWFKQIKFMLELNRIYVYTLSYKDKDFVEYTFNTFCKDDKINYGEYHYNIFNVGNAKLFINEDNTYVFESLYYYDLKNEVVSFTGSYEINNNSIILYIDNKEIVLDIYPHNLLINSSLSTFDLKKYLGDENTINYSFWS